MSDEDSYEDYFPLARGRPTTGVSQSAPRPSSPGPRGDLGDIERVEDTKRFKELFTCKSWLGAPAQNPITQDRSQRRALVVAVSYGNRTPPPHLGGTYIDAYRIIQMLVKKFNYTYSDICVLADIDLINKETKRPDKSRAPTRENIERGLEWLCGGQGGEAARRFFYFAGHGYRQIAKGGTISNEGIMPSDIDFREFVQCDNCDCNNISWDSRKTSESWLLPKEYTVLWDYELNEMLSQNIQPGTKLTVIFDCCHSGGTLRSTISNGLDVTDRKDARNQKQRAGVGTQDTIMLDDFSPAPNDGIQVLPGNLLGLPVQTDLVLESTSTLPGNPVTRGSAVASTCELFTNQYLRPSNGSFPEECEVLCWAACTALQNAQETPSGGGWFTTAFTSYVNHYSVGGGTYQYLNRHIHNKFHEHNQRKDMAENPQHPKFFTSNKVAKHEGYFQGTLDM